MNWLSVCLKYSPIVALSLNFIGAILLIYHAGAYTGKGVKWVSTGENGKALETIYLLNPTMFKIGIGLIAAGFFIQMINELFRLEWLKSG